MPGPLTLELTVESGLNGVRVDSFLVKHLRNYTAWRMQRLAAAGQVLVDHVPADPTRRVFSGETIHVTLLEPPDKLLQPEQVPFDRIYEDPWMLIVSKPAGVISHPTGESQSGTLANGIQRYLDLKSSSRGLLRPGIVHRLDRQTSGLMVVALHHASHAELSTAFESSRVRKTYVCVVEGLVTGDAGTIDLPIGRAKAGRGVLMSARGDAVQARPALTRYRVLQRYRRHTLVEARPQTGRNHQIRVHFAQIGHPLVGDEFYGPNGTYTQPSPLHFRMQATADSPHHQNGGDFSQLGRHALHAASLEFAHPITSVWMSFHAPLAEDMQRLIDDLGNSREPTVPARSTFP